MSGFDLFKRLLGTERRQHMPRTQAVRGTRMLVVDDSPTIRAVLGKMLTQDGYLVSKAGDGETALRLAREEKPELIFLDIVMPGMNGFAVLRALRREPGTHGIPIVMISGNLQATEQFYVQRFGADDFMKKPFGRAEVFGRIQHLVEAGRLSARDPVLDPPQDLPVESATDGSIPDVGLPDADDPHMVTPAFTGALDPQAEEPATSVPAGTTPTRE
ncbi:response regulator [Dyella lutea]|uniref:Response regulator n=1 Tax=Dyella lutea TaxID=2950441 RepID=A0ABT1FDW1_9GAMM|nr:response regulator [Dyella lutea]MCP1375562.1 response regulator [Dyella lutea]